MFSNEVRWRLSAYIGNIEHDKHQKSFSVEDASDGSEALSTCGVPYL